MKSHAPLDAIDPLLCAFADRELTKSSMKILESHYEVLRCYTTAVFADSSPHANGLLSDHILPNHNRFILFLRERYEEAKKSVEECRNLGENCRPPNSQVTLCGTVGVFRYLVGNVFSGVFSRL